MQLYTGDHMKTWMFRISILLALLISVVALPLTSCGDDDDDDDNGVLGGDDITHDLASAGATTALTALLEGAEIPFADLIGDETAGLIMSAIFGGGPDPDQEILDDLAEMKSLLLDIEAKLDNLAQQLSQIEKLMAIYTSDIEKTVIQQGLLPYTNQIQAYYENYTSLQNDTGTWITDDAVLHGLATDILDNSNGVFPQLVGIHNALTGESGLSDSVLRAIADTAGLKAYANGDQLNYYYVLENYFGSVLRYETWAATLMVEALRYREASGHTIPGYTQDAPYFMKWYVAHIKDQVENFLEAVEYFVALSAYPHKSLTDFVPDSDTIFWRADLTAAWLSPLHRPDPTTEADGQELLVYRVVGSPERVKSYPDTFNDNYFAAPCKRMIYKPSGQTEYFVPVYELTDTHTMNKLSESPYVQFHPGNLFGTYIEAGTVSEATSILYSKYYSSVYNTSGELIDEAYTYRNDFLQRAVFPVKVGKYNPKGLVPEDGDKSITYGHALDIQHPPALNKGHWYLQHTHDEKSKMQFVGYDLGGEPVDTINPSGAWTQTNNTINVNAWPSRYLDPDDYFHVLGGFREEYANVGSYYWAGDDSLILTANYDIDVVRTLISGATPGTRWWGSYIWLQCDNQHGVSFHANDYSSGGPVNYKSGLAVGMVHDQLFYISLGSRAEADWQNSYCDVDAWHHWEGNQHMYINDLYFTLSQ